MSWENWKNKKSPSWKRSRDYLSLMIRRMAKRNCRNTRRDGGGEAAIFAADLFRMYNKYAENQGWKVELFDSSETDLGGFKEVTFSIEGKNAYQKTAF